VLFARTLYPLGIVNTWYWIRLLTVVPLSMPAVIKKDWNDVKTSAFGDYQKSKDIFEKSLRIPNVRCHMKEHS